MTSLANAGKAPATISSYLAAVVVAHRTAGHAIDRKSPLIADVWQGIARTKARPARQARPLLALELRDLLDGLADEDPADVRDAALLSIGWAAALRRGELVGLDWQQQGAGRGFVSIDERGISITLIRSKASQEKPVLIAVPAADMPEAVAALEHWAERAGIKPGSPVFRGINRHGQVSAQRLTDRSVARIIKDRVHDAARRRGMSEAEADVPQYRIQQHTRHKTAEMVARYVREADKWGKSGLKGVWRPATGTFRGAAFSR